MALVPGKTNHTEHPKVRQPLNLRLSLIGQTRKGALGVCVVALVFCWFMKAQADAAVQDRQTDRQTVLWPHNRAQETQSVVNISVKSEWNVVWEPAATRSKQTEPVSLSGCQQAPQTQLLSLHRTCYLEWLSSHQILTIHSILGPEGLPTANLCLSLIRIVRTSIPFKILTCILLRTKIPFIWAVLLRCCSPIL